MRPGSLSRQARARGKMYYQLSYTQGGKGRTEYVRSEHVGQVEDEIRTYGLFRKLAQKWIDLEIEFSKINRHNTKA